MEREERERYMSMKQQVLPFDFWETEKEEAEKKLKEQTDALPHFPEPKNDNEFLLECQYEYRHGDKKALVRMYQRAKTLSLKFINAIAQKNKHVRSLPWENKKIKAEDAATYMIEQYIKRADFAVTKNFPGYLFLRVAHELYYRRKVDKVVDFVDLQKFIREGDEDKDECHSEECMLQEREIVHYQFTEETESEEDQEQREAKAFYKWKQKQKKKESE